MDRNGVPTTRPPCSPTCCIWPVDRRGRSGFVLIFAACVAIFVYGMVSSMLGTINPGLATKFHLDNIQTGYLALAQGVGFVIASVSARALTARHAHNLRPPPALAPPTPPSPPLPTPPTP